MSADLVKQTTLEPGVSVNAAIAQKGPVSSVFVYAGPVDFAHNDFFSVDQTLRYDRAIWSANETLSPEFNPIAPGRRFVTYAVRGRDIAAFRHRVTSLNQFPG